MNTYFKQGNMHLKTGSTKFFTSKEYCLWKISCFCSFVPHYDKFLVKYIFLLQLLLLFVSLRKIESLISLFYCQLIMLQNHAIIWKIWFKKSSLLGRLNLFSAPELINPQVKSEAKDHNNICTVFQILYFLNFRSVSKLLL